MSVHRMLACTRLTLLVLSSSTVGGLWHPGGGSVAVSDPGQLCHSVLIAAVAVGRQPAHRRGNHHHGDRLPGLRGSCQREPASAAHCKIYLKGLFFWFFTFRSTLCFSKCHFGQKHHSPKDGKSLHGLTHAGEVLVEIWSIRITVWTQNTNCISKMANINLLLYPPYFRTRK